MVAEDSFELEAWVQELLHLCSSRCTGSRIRLASVEQ